MIPSRADRNPLTGRLASAIPPGLISRLFPLGVLLALIPATLLPAAESWTDSTGAHRIEADFLALRGETVYLKKTNGVTIAVALARLDAPSQQLARRLASAPATADAPDAAARELLTSLQLGEFRAAWNALPASYQQDVTDVIRAFGQNMDPDVWNAGTRIIKKAVAVLREKKSFILAYPALQQPGLNAASVAENWDLVVGLLETIAGSELMDLQQLKTLDVAAFLNGTGQQIGQQMGLVNKALRQDFDPANLPIPAEFPGAEVAALGNLENATITTVQVQGDAGTIRIENNGESKDLELVRVEGKWLPRDMAQGWDPGIEQIKQFLTTAMPEKIKASKQQLLSPLSPLKLVEGVLDQLLATENQQQFDQVIDGIQQMVGGMMGAPPCGAAPAAADPFGASPAGGGAPAGADPFGAPPTGGAAPAADDAFETPPPAETTSGANDPFGS